MKQILITIILSLLVTNAFASGECQEGERAYTNKCVNNNCTFCYNSTTQDLRIVPNSDVQKGDAVDIGLHNWDTLPTKNVTIEEGITGSTRWVFGYGGTVGCTTCILKLPSTFQREITDSYNTPFWNNQFGIIDLSDVQNLGISLPTDVSSQTIILNPNSNVTVSAGGAYQGTSGKGLTIQCKGTDLKACQDMVTTSKNLSVEYYKAYDEKGNIIEEWTPQGKRSYTYANNGDYAIYDSDGNFLGNFMADGSKRRIYTVDEAAAVTGGKNTFSIKYR